MIMTISKALDNPLITVIDRNDDPGIVIFQLGKIVTPITIEIIREDENKYSLDVSHRMRQSENHTSSLPAFRNCKTPGDAVHELVQDFDRLYSDMLETSVPGPSWLEQNPYFNF